MKIDGLKTWDDWCNNFQKIEIFEELIQEIFNRHKLPYTTIENTFPGTNAVFKVGTYIVKIFVPKEIKGWLEDEYQIELEKSKYLEHTKYAPNMISNGSILRNYEWKYIVYEHMKGEHFFKVINTLTDSEKRTVIWEIKEFLSCFNQRVTTDNNYIINRVKQHNRWDYLDITVQEELFQYLETLDLSNSVIVHGDITGDNVLYTKQGIKIIDFGDCCEAPFYYEYAPIILDLFQCDAIMVHEFFKDTSLEEGIADTINSILIHDFGGWIAKDLLSKAHQISNLKELRTAMQEEIFKKIKL